MRSSCLAGSVVLAGLLGAGCDPPYCGPATDVELVDDSPRIGDMRVLNDAVPGDPWEIIFVAEFSDDDGDLEGGVARVYLNGEDEPIELDLFDVFRQGGLPPTAREGTLAMPLRFADTVPDGADVRVGTQLVDDEKHRSNCYGLDLEFSVEE